MRMIHSSRKLLPAAVIACLAIPMLSASGDETFDEFAKLVKKQDEAIETRTRACVGLCKRGPIEAVVPICVSYLEEMLKRTRKDEDNVPILKAGVADQIGLVAKALVDSGGREAAPAVPVLLRSIAQMRRTDDLPNRVLFLNLGARMEFIAWDHPKVWEPETPTSYPPDSYYPSRPPAPPTEGAAKVVVDRADRRTEVAQLLAKIAPSSAIEGLAGLMKNDPDVAVRVAMAAALGATRSEQAIATLLGGLKAEPWELRAASAKALGQIGSKVAIPKLEVMAEVDDKAGLWARGAIEKINARNGQSEELPPVPGPEKKAEPRDEPGRPRADAPKPAKAEGAAAIRLIYLDRVNDRLVAQEPGESDEAFAERIRLRLEAAKMDTSMLPDEFHERRRKIEADWPTTQSEQDLKFLRPEKESAEAGRDESELEVAKYQTLVEGNPKSVVLPSFLRTAKELRARYQSRLSILDTRIGQLEKRSAGGGR